MTSCQHSTGSWLVNKGGAAAIALFEDFKQVLPGFGGEGLKAEIVEDEKIGAA